MYIDYVVKKLAEIFVKNVFILGAVFFGEKFVVEFLSRKVFDKLVTHVSIWYITNSHTQSDFYHGLISIFMGVLLLAEMWVLTW